MHIFKNTKKLHLYKSLDKLKILTFWKILETQNACLLDFDWNENKKYSPEDQYEIEQTFIRLYDEFYLLRDNNQHKHEIDKGFDELQIDGQILNIYQNKEALIKFNDFKGLVPDEFINENAELIYKRLKGLQGIGSKIKVSSSKTIEENITMLDRVLNSLENTKNLNKGKRKKAIEQEKKNVFEIVGFVEAELNRNLPINDIVCSQWIVYENQALERLKQRKRDDG